METEAHANLKRLAMRFLRELGFQAIAGEVMCPIHRGRVDVAGYIDAAPPPAHASARDEPDLPGVQRDLFDDRTERRPIEPRTVIIECKQDRSDFLRERHELERLLDRRERLEHLRRRLEVDELPALEPELRRSDGYLFECMEAWDFERSSDPRYRGVLRRIDRTDAAIHKGAKLSRMSRYRLADRLYVLAPAAMIRPREVPAGWGLLEARAGTAWGATGIHVRRPAPHLRSPGRFRARLLRNIAAAATRAAMASHGVS